jgi:hypothetical protein
MKKRRLITLLFITLLSTFSCTNQTVNSSPSNKPSISSTSSPQVSVTPTPEPTPSQDENIINPLPHILAFGNPDDYYKALNKDNEYSNSDHIFYMNEKVLKEGITKEAILNKDIVDVTEGSYPEYSPDNKFISFLHLKSVYSSSSLDGGLYIMKAGDLTGKTKKLISEDYIYKYDWINNDEILIKSEKDLYIVNINTKEKRNILTKSHFLYGLSPNKKKLSLVETKYSMYPRRDTYDLINKDKIYQSLFIYDLETKSKNIIFEDKLLDYIEINNSTKPYFLPHYYFSGNIKWSDDNENLVCIYDMSTKIVKIHTKTKEIVEIYDINKDKNVINKNILEILHYTKDGNLLFLADLSGGYYDRYPEGILLVLKNTFVNKNANLVNIIPLKIFLSKEKYLDNIYFYYSPYIEYLKPLDIKKIFSEDSINFSYKSLKNILPYSFLH